MQANKGRARLLAAILFGVGLPLAGASRPGSAESQGAYRFDGAISREVLENYLARSVTMMDLCTGKGNVTDNIRMLVNIGAKFAGRTLYLWGGERYLERHLDAARRIAAQVHAAVPEMILQAGIFEFVTPQVGEVPVPERVLQEFGLPAETRGFRYEAMLFEDGRHRWGAGSAPDITRPETRLWFYHLATSYIDVGMEAIHFGQVHIIGSRDEGFRNWWDLIARVRAYAARHARRHMVLCDAHAGGGVVVDGRLLFDFHSSPLCLKEGEDEPQKAILQKGWGPYGHSRGGITPSGWKCASLPYLVELDNWSSSGKGGQPGLRDGGFGWVWGYDEMSWFAHQPDDYRDEWLRYAWRWVREADPNGYLQMPGSRILHDPVAGKGWYHANSPGQFARGFGQEEAIKRIWAGDGRLVSVDASGKTGPAGRKRDPIVLPDGTEVLIVGGVAVRRRPKGKAGEEAAPEEGEPATAEGAKRKPLVPRAARPAADAQEPEELSEPKEPKEPKEPEEPPEAGRLLKEAETLFIEGDVSGAGVLFERVVEEFPGTPSAAKALKYVELLK